MKRKDIVSSTLFDPVEKTNWVVNKLVLGIRINDTYGEEVRYELNLKNASLSLFARSYVYSSRSHPPLPLIHFSTRRTLLCTRMSKYGVLSCPAVIRYQLSVGE